MLDRQTHRRDRSLPALVAVHGVRRGAEQQAMLFGPAAAAQGRLVIAPWFEEAGFPRYQRLGNGAVSALTALLSELEREPEPNLPRVQRFGFSAGAQFAHRFAMRMPQRVSRLTLASAGW